MQLLKVSIIINNTYILLNIAFCTREGTLPLWPRAWLLAVFLDCLNTILTALFCFSIHLTQLAQPHTQWAKHLRSFAKWNTLVKTIHLFIKTIFCYHMKNTRCIWLNSSSSSSSSFLLLLLRGFPVSPSVFFFWLKTGELTCCISIVLKPVWCVYN